MSGHRHRRDSQGHHSSCSGRLSRGACCGDHCWQRSSTGRHAELQRTHGNHSMTASFIQPSVLPWQGDSTREATMVVSGAWACTGTVVVATGTTAAAAGASPWWPSCGDPCWQRGSTGRHAQLKHRHSRHAIDLITASRAGTLAQDEPTAYYRMWATQESEYRPAELQSRMWRCRGQSAFIWNSCHLERL